MTAATRVPAIAPHAMLIVPGSARSVGTGKAADLYREEDYPVEAVCSICHQAVERQLRQPGRLDWKHTGRKADR